MKRAAASGALGRNLHTRASLGFCVTCCDLALEGSTVIITALAVLIVALAIKTFVIKIRSAMRRMSKLDSGA